MPPRHAYWTIILEGKPTAFRAHTRDELMPTFRQLQTRHPDIALMWFARGRLWPSPEAALEATRSRARERREPGWRPGGAHRDPRDRFKVPRDEKRRRFAVATSKQRHDTRRGPTSDRPPGERPAGPSAPRVDRGSHRPSGPGRPFGSTARRPPGPKGSFDPTARRPARPKGSFDPTAQRPAGPKAHDPGAARPTGPKGSSNPQAGRPPRERPHSGRSGARPERRWPSRPRNPKDGGRRGGGGGGGRS